MAIRFYDDAVTNLVKKWVKDPSLTILKPDDSTRFFENKLLKNQDSPLTLPLIAISRSKDIEILETTKQTKTFNGVTVESTDQNTLTLNAIPIKINYQLDIYTRWMADADEYMRNFIFNFINYPELEITLPYQGKDLRHKFTLRLESTLTDNSDIKEHLFADEFTRFTIRLYTDDAYLFSIPTLTNTYMEEASLNIANKEKIVENSANLITNEKYPKSSNDPLVWINSR